MFASLEDILLDAVGLLPQGEQRWCRHPLAWLVEAADDICYALLDLEDGLEMGILRYEEVVEILGQRFGDCFVTLVAIELEFTDFDVGLAGRLADAHFI